MDIVEFARQRAAALHDELVCAGYDPAQSYAFVLEEAGRRDIEVRGYPPGHAMLNGGRALFDPAGTIRHERTGDEFLDAFFVAHEIGHAELGGHTEITASIEIDPTRPSDGGASGAERAVDYSRKARQEGQMDSPRWQLRKSFERLMTWSRFKYLMQSGFPQLNRKFQRPVHRSH